MLNKLMVSFALVATVALSAGEAERKAAEELLVVTKYELMMEKSVDQAVSVATQMDPNLVQHEAALREFYQKHMSADALREDVLDLYADVFTADELREICSFYHTQAGQKSIEKMPEVFQRSMQLAQTRVVENMGELQEMLTKAD